MLDAELLKSIAAQLMTSASVRVEGKSIPVRRTSRQHLRTAAFTVGGSEYQAIEQNPEKPSRWGQLARSGRQVVQFKDAERNRFVAVVVDGEVTFYGASKKRAVKAPSRIQSVWNQVRSANAAVAMQPKPL